VTKVSQSLLQQEEAQSDDIFLGDPLVDIDVEEDLFLLVEIGGSVLFCESDWLCLANGKHKQEMPRGVNRPLLRPGVSC
jgi:hypothetical protein